MRSTIPTPMVPFSQEEWLKYRLGAVFMDNGAEVGTAIDDNIKVVVATLRGEAVLPFPFDHQAYYATYRALLEDANVADLELRARRPLASRNGEELPPQLERIKSLVKIEPIRNKRELRCDHCRLPPSLPPFYLVRSVEKKGGFFDRYPGMVLGAKSNEEGAATAAMWHAVSLLRPRVPSEKFVPHNAEQHFTNRVGPPPWLEHFASLGKTIRLEEKLMRERVINNTVALAALKEHHVLVKQRIGIARKLLQMSNPDDERARLHSEVHGLREFVRKHHAELMEVVNKNTCDVQVLDINKGIYAIRIEEIRRLCALLNDEVVAREAAHAKEAADVFGTADLDMATVRNKLLRLLQDLPSAEFGRSTKRQQHGGTFSQCKDCLLLYPFSRFCTVTGDAHTFEHVEEEAAPQYPGNAGYTLNTLALPGNDAGQNDSAAGSSAANAADAGKGGSSMRTELRRRKPPTKNPEVDAAIELLCLMTEHLLQFVAACVHREFKDMQLLTEATSMGLVAQRFPGYASLLHETEVMFRDWLSVMSGAGPVRKEQMQIKDKSLLTVEALTAAEKRILVLRRETREMTQMLEKRPNSKNNGISVDMHTFGMIVSRITDLTRRNAALKARTIKAEQAKKRTIEEREDREKKGMRAVGHLTGFSMLKSLVSAIK